MKGVEGGGGEGQESLIAVNLASRLRWAVTTNLDRASHGEDWAQHRELAAQLEIREHKNLIDVETSLDSLHLK